MRKEFYLSEICIRIAEILGLHFQMNHGDDLERRLIAVAKELKMDTSISGIYEWLSKDQLTNIELKTLSAHLTIGETYFFREKPALELFIQKIIPELIIQRSGKNEHLKIWSAGCSSGEEPYTLAILLKEHFPELDNWDIKIVATDISPIAIQKALTGEYTEWSFREIEQDLVKKYFTLINKKWKIDPLIKKMIHFSFLNLSENSYPSAQTDTENVDVIFCRNVMMYFTPNVIKEVGARFNDALMENGWLITSPVELNDEYFSNFERILFGKGIFYQKTNKLEKPKKLPIETIPHRPFVTINNRTIKKAEIKNPDRKERINSKKPLAEISSKDAIDPDVYFQKGQYLQCIDRCLRSIDQGNLTNEIFSILVKSYANLGFLTDGEKVIGNILEKHAATPEMYYFYASLFNEQNDFVQTEVNLKKAIYLNHRHVLSHLMLGNVFRYNGKTQLAIKHFETTLELLKKYDDHEIVPDSDGMTAGSIKELTQQIINRL